MTRDFATRTKPRKRANAFRKLWYRFLWSKRPITTAAIKNEHFQIEKRDSEERLLEQKHLDWVPNVPCVYCGEKPTKYPGVTMVRSGDYNFYPTRFLNKFAHLSCKSMFSGPNSLRDLRSKDPNSECLPILSFEQEERLKKMYKEANKSY